MEYTVKLTYFTEHGKFYTEATTKSGNKYIWEIWDDIRELRKRKRLPGLVENHSDYHIYVEVPNHPHNHPALLLIGPKTA